MPLLSEKCYLMEIGLFGSFVNGDASEKSDIDFLVRIDPPAGTYRKNKEALNIFNSCIKLADSLFCPAYFSFFHYQSFDILITSA